MEKESDQAAPSAVRKLFGRGTQAAFTAGAITVLGTFWSNAWRDKGDLTNETVPVRVNTTLEKAHERASAFHTALAPATGSYFADKTGMNGRLPGEGDPISWAFFEEQKKDFEILDSCTSDRMWGSLHAVAFRQQSTGKIFLACAGFETKTPSEWLPDLWVGFKSTAGAIPENDLKLFQQFADKIRQEHGEIDAVCGHSFGAYMGCCLKPYLKPETELYAFDTAGVTKGLLHNLSKYYQKPISEIETTLKHNVYSLNVGKNTYNRLGTQPGESYTLNPPELDGGWAQYSPFGGKHHPISTFASRGNAIAEQIHPESPDGFSSGPAFYTTLWLSVLLAANFCDIKRLLPERSKTTRERR